MGKIWSPQGPFWSSTWVPGGRKTPPNLTQNDRFLVNHDNLTLWLHRQVDLFPFDSEGSIMENLQPTGSRIGGPGGGGNQPQIWHKMTVFWLIMIIWLINCTIKSIRFSLTQGGVLGEIWSPQGLSWWKIGGPGGFKTAPHLTQNGRLLAKTWSFDSLIAKASQFFFLHFHRIHRGFIG